MVEGIGESAERQRRMLPFCLMNSRRMVGDNEGPSPDSNLLKYWF